MKKLLLSATGLFSVLFSLSWGTASGQLSFTNANNLLSNSGMRSGCSVTVADANNDGLDDIIRMDEGHLINFELQERDGSFTNHFVADIGGGSAWAMTTADVDHNGWRDIVADGSNGIRLIKVFENAGVISSTNTLLANSGFFLQNATFCDMNNDGWIDLFCCDDNDVSKLYLNDGAGNLNPSTMVNFAVNPGLFYGNDPADSGNYGSAWIDFDNDQDLDLYVAHCRQSSTSPTDERRINRLFVNDGNNNYTEQAATFGINIGWQTWTSSFGDIDNDGDLDLVLTNHDHASQVFENDGSGMYTELLNTGFSTSGITPIESVLEDFDNDGYMDILVTGSEWQYWRNNGNKTFTREYGLMAEDGMLSFAIGDLNHDGFVDIYASYGDIYTSPSPNVDDVLYLNDGNANRFITFNLKGTISNLNAIGSRVTIYGPWGVQVREVRAGESYGTCNSSQLHFGLGLNSVVDSAVVWFPSGTTTTFTNLDANQFVTVVEGGCALTGNILTGPFILCTGQTLILNAASGFTSYDWSTGATTQSLSVTSAGSYNVMVTDANGCSNISPSAIVVLNPDETPTVVTTGDLEFCEGGAVTLTSSPAASYAWSDGSTTQSISATQTGTYEVTIQGTCGPFTSLAIAINVLDAPEPVGTGAAGPSGSQLLLTATGSNPAWYDLQTNGTLLGSGPNFTTPALFSTTTYWVEDVTDYPGAIDFTGMIYHQGTPFSGGSNTNGSVDFDVLAPSTLVSVKVYTDTPGMREIQLLNNTGTAINSLMVNIPLDTSRITLNFPLVPGTDYRLTTNAAVNTTNFGTATPRLQRSSQGVLYPYSIPNLVSITGSNQGPGFYYYFYDWEVQEPSYMCTSDRVPVIADITTGISEMDANGVSVYPNPANDVLFINTGSLNGQIVLTMTDITGRVVRNQQFTGDMSSASALSLSGIAPGVYQIRLQSNEASSIVNVVLK
jgi:hypothetical protein